MKKTLNQIETEMAVLECKDHWDMKDNAEWDALLAEKEALLPQSKEPIQEEEDKKTIEKYAAMGLEFVGYDEKGAMRFESAGMKTLPERKNIKKGAYNFF